MSPVTIPSSTRLEGVESLRDESGHHSEQHVSGTARCERGSSRRIDRDPSVRSSGHGGRSLERDDGTEPLCEFTSRRPTIAVDLARLDPEQPCCLTRMWGQDGGRLALA